MDDEKRRWNTSSRNDGSRKRKVSGGIRLMQ